MRNLKHILSIALICFFAFKTTAQELEEYSSARNEVFVAQIKTVHPWGDETMIMIPYSYHTSGDENEEHGFLTIKYDETI